MSTRPVGKIGCRAIDVSAGVSFEGDPDGTSPALPGRGQDKTGTSPALPGRGQDKTGTSPALPERGQNKDGTSPASPKDAGAVLVTRDTDMPEGHWVLLGDGAKITTKDKTTTRELTFFGPGRARPCTHGEEEAWQWRGRFASTAGAGEHPGAEVWLVTPAGVVRYPGGELTVSATDTESVVTVSSGVAFLWPATGTKTERTALPGFKAAAGADAGPKLGVGSDGWWRLDGGSAHIVAKSSTSSDGAARAASEDCTKLAQTAHELGVRLLEPDASVADLANQHIVARKLARASCALALARVDSLPAGKTRDDLVATVRKGESTWHSLER
jgi:hypothetical protein